MMHDPITITVKNALVPSLTAAAHSEFLPLEMFVSRIITAELNRRPMRASAPAVPDTKCSGEQKIPLTLSVEGFYELRVRAGLVGLSWQSFAGELVESYAAEQRRLALPTDPEPAPGPRHNHKARALTAADESRAMQLRTSGLSLEAIAQQLGCAPWSVKRVLKRRGRYTRLDPKPPRALTPTEINEVLRLRRDGTPLSRIATAVRSHVKLVRRVLVERNAYRSLSYQGRKQCGQN
jgi:hypothetical protein